MPAYDKKRADCCVSRRAVTGGVAWKRRICTQGPVDSTDERAVPAELFAEVPENPQHEGHGQGGRKEVSEFLEKVAHRPS